MTRQVYDLLGNSTITESSALTNYSLLHNTTEFKENKQQRKISLFDE